MTTNKANFTKQSMYENTVGRKVMRTLDQKNVPLSDRDEQLIVEHGIWRRGQKTSDEEI